MIRTCGRRRLAALLCAAMLLTHSAALADDAAQTQPAENQQQETGVQAASLVEAIVPEQTTQEVPNPEKTYSKISVRASLVEGVLAASVSGENGLDIRVAVYDADGNRAASHTVAQGSGTAYFRDLAAGNYTVRASYVDEEAHDAVGSSSASVTIEAPVDVEAIIAAEQARIAQEEAAKREQEAAAQQAQSAQQVETVQQAQTTQQAQSVQKVDTVQQTQSAGVTDVGGNDDTPPARPELHVTASVSGTTITVTLSGNQNAQADVMLTRPDGTYEIREAVSDSATLTFAATAAGTYNVYAEYCQGGGSDETDVEVAADAGSTGGNTDTTGGSTDMTGGNTDTTGGSTDMTGGNTDTTGGSAETTGGNTDTTGGNTDITGSTAPDGKYTIEVTTGKGTLSVMVKDALAQAMYVEITKPDGSTTAQTIASGSGTATFTGLEAGVYSVYLDYVTAVSGVSPVMQDGVVLTEGADVVPVISGQFTVDAGVGGQTITVKVSGAKEQAVDVVLIRPDKTTDVRQLAAGNGTITFDNLSDGSYSVVVAYQTEVQGVSSVKREGLVVATQQTAASAIVATAQGGTARVDVTVTAASSLPVGVTLLKNGVIQATQRIEAGVGSVSFTALAAGTYSVSVDYAPSQQNVAPYVINNILVSSIAAPLTITGVTGGENKLVVTGTAQPNADVTLTSEPAGAAAVVRADANGHYTATLVCSAGTYTAVYAQCGESRATATGTFVATAPLVKPPISVNPIGHKDSTVIARSTPGTIVNLGTYDYGQTLTADARGMLQYSLPHEYPNGTKVTFTVYYGNGKEFSYQYVVTVGAQYQYPTLKRGDKNTAVFEMTQKLVDLGYLRNPTTAYNDTVVAAVKQFQRNNGLAVDGIAGPLTQAMLRSVAAIGAYESGVYPTLVRGDRGLTLIYTLQQRLKDLGYYTIRVDGIFGSGTQRAVRDFQAVNGLPVTGKADHATQVLLYSASARPAGSAATGGYVTLSRSDRYDVRVVTLQRRLKALGYLAGSVDGYFGSQTYRAVRNFQYVNGLSVTGVADPYTQQVLYSSAAKTYSGAVSGSTASQGYTLLYWGCEGEAVKRLQNALLSAGYTQVRKADGVFGQWTYDAVCAFQRDRGLTVDGVAGRATQNMLYGTNY